MINDPAVKVLFITEVDYDVDNRYVERAKVEFLSGNEQTARILERKDIVELLKNKTDILTLWADRRGKTHFAKVINHQVNGEEYIRTTTHEASWDNLGDLPSISR